MEFFIVILVCSVAGIIAGIIAGFSCMSAAYVIVPMLITFLDIPVYMAVGPNLFMMFITALAGTVSHFVIGGVPILTVLILCTSTTLLWMSIAAVIANRAQPKTLNWVTGGVLVILGVVVLGVNLLT